MKKILYIYLLLISSSIGAMQPANKNQMPTYDKNTVKKVVGTALIVVPHTHLALTPLYIIAPPIALGATLLNMSATALGTYLIMDATADQQRNKNNNNK